MFIVLATYVEPEPIINIKIYGSGSIFLGTQGFVNDGDQLFYKKAQHPLDITSPSIQGTCQSVAPSGILVQGTTSGLVIS